MLSFVFGEAGWFISKLFNYSGILLQMFKNIGNWRK